MNSPVRQTAKDEWIVILIVCVSAICVEYSLHINWFKFDVMSLEWHHQLNISNTNESRDLNYIIDVCYLVLNNMLKSFLSLQSWLTSTETKSICLTFVTLVYKVIWIYEHHEIRQSHHITMYHPNLTSTLKCCWCCLLQRKKIRKRNKNLFEDIFHSIDLILTSAQQQRAIQSILFIDHNTYYDDIIPVRPASYYLPSPNTLHQTKVCTQSPLGFRNSNRFLLKTRTFCVKTRKLSCFLHFIFVSSRSSSCKQMKSVPI